jgi:arylsulfatase A-like enzyme
MIGRTVSIPKYFAPIAAVFAVCTAPLFGAERAAPNIIVIVSDDQGYRDAGFQGGTDIPTPNLDRLAAGGVVFTDAYVTGAVCGPSRAGFINGRYPPRFGFGGTPGYRPEIPLEGLPLEETTLAEALRSKGYTSALIGKWHLGAHESLHPLNRGFDEFFGHVGGGKRYFPELLTRKNTKDAKNEWESYHTWITRGFEPVKTTGYLTEEFNREALGFVRRQAATPEKPFFLYLAYNALHSPFEAPKNEIAKFQHIKNEKRRNYAAMVSVMDRGIGQLLDILDEQNLADNTLIFFFSDNGGPTKDQVTDNTPLRGGKSSPYEGGFRVPMAARWPGVIPAGSKFSKPVSSMDIFATIAAVNRIPENPERPLDGVDLIPYLTGENDGAPHERIYLLIGENNGVSMREGDYKIVQSHDTSVQLYNLREDIGEERDLAAADPERLSRMLATFKTWEAQLKPSVLEGMRPEEWGGKPKPEKAKAL